MKIKAKTKKGGGIPLLLLFFGIPLLSTNFNGRFYNNFRLNPSSPPLPSVSVYIETNLKIKIQYSIFILRSCSLCEQKKAKKPDRKCNLYKKLEDR